MSAISAAILAVIQGLTEFLPVSSSGHLVLGEALLGVHAFKDSIAFELVVHLGTFLAVLVIFWNDILNLLGVFFSRLITPGQWKSEYKENSDCAFQTNVYPTCYQIDTTMMALFLLNSLTTILQPI